MRIATFTVTPNSQEGFPGGSVVKKPPANAGNRRCVFSPWLGKMPWRRKWQPTPVSVPGESHGQRSLAGYGPQGRKEPDRAEHKRTCRQPGCIGWGCVSSRPECVRSEPSLPLSASSFRGKRSLPELSSDRKRGAGQPLSAGRCAGWVGSTDLASGLRHHS